MPNSKTPSGAGQAGLPKRGKGRMSAVAEAAYAEKLEAFCEDIRQIAHLISGSPPAAGATSSKIASVSRRATSTGRRS
jgi:hypothetical protein